MPTHYAAQNAITIKVNAAFKAIKYKCKTAKDFSLAVLHMHI